MLIYFVRDRRKCLNKRESIRRCFFPDFKITAASFGGLVLF